MDHVTERPLSGKWTRTVSVLAIGTLLSVPGIAQQVQPQPSPTATGAAAPAAGAKQAAVLPVLSPEQREALPTMLMEARFAHGLVAEAGGGTPIPSDNDGLVRAALDFAKAVHSGRLAPEDFQSDWGLRPAAYDPLPGFADAVKQDRLAQWIERLPPPYSGYDGLKAGLDTYRRIAAAGGWQALAAGPDLGPGATGAAVSALRKRLAIEDPEVVPTGDQFDAELQAAVQRAQRRYGLNPTGTVSTQTRAALNVKVADRVHQIMANMERWRWLPQEMPVNRIQVNIASAQLAVFEGDQPVASMKAVTGAPGGRETPMLSSRIHSIVLNPPWNVPAGIAAKELFPKGSAYLAANGFKVIGEGANRRLQQQAGPRSALGRYKFDFDNPFAVYLHDTPSQSTFSRFDRLASHGCVRLEKPAALARLLLRDDPDWSPDRIQSTVDSAKTVRVALKQQVAVYLLYWTSYASASGTMSFRSDPYGWDKVLAAKVEKRSATKTLAAR
ncbi:murein L,D-transpeptidase [Sphingomonas canadensis]|uniref:Murein L,D-transpeptidase n=1 Tax=Sphingomonas canadensis TaxID=1219257 RepID=A0ABW3HDF7_9SPHN|nr:L,D-transpeptidase family protein [Sphingomonas canadensis]MCW3838423.1 L,D-transpeptidase family protein [Sphingomonas canadensis]